MTHTKRARTRVTRAMLEAARGGQIMGDDYYARHRLWVECPSSYIVGNITAEDILHDDQIRVVAEDA